MTRRVLGTTRGAEDTFFGGGCKYYDKVQNHSKMAISTVFYMPTELRGAADPVQEHHWVRISELVHGWYGRSHVHCEQVGLVLHGEVNSLV